MSDTLADRPLGWTRRGEEILITHRANPATVLRGDAAARSLARMAGLDDDAAQQLMARVTGNFKRGNERR